MKLAKSPNGEGKPMTFADELVATIAAISGLATFATLSLGGVTELLLIDLDDGWWLKSDHGIPVLARENLVPYLTSKSGHQNDRQGD
jgi:hypothetical protein